MGLRVVKAQTDTRQDRCKYPFRFAWGNRSWVKWFRFVKKVDKPLSYPLHLRDVIDLFVHGQLGKSAAPVQHGLRLVLGSLVEDKPTHMQLVA